ncbi:transposase [Rhizobium etli]|uniref:transposase n=1 Tax=Rhizobium etli TaxID=29449 RepID=UPI001612E03E
MTPLRGWGPKGKRLRSFAPHEHWRTLTFLGALRCDRLTAPCVFDDRSTVSAFAPMSSSNWYRCSNPATSLSWILGSHESVAIRQVIRNTGVRLWYLPPYPPGLSGILCVRPVRH